MKLSGIITVPLHIGDFLTGTMHMDTLEKGAYVMLIFAHYQTGETGLPNDDRKLSRIAGVTPKVWSRIRDTLAEKFETTGDFWVHDKVIDTLRKVHEKSSSQRDKALKKHNRESATAQPRHSQPKPKPNILDTNVSNTPISPKQKSGKKDVVYPLEFEMFWSTYPSYRRESRNKAFPAWEKVIREGRATPEQLQASAEAYRASDEAMKDGGKYAKGLCAWLNGDRFLWDYTKKGEKDDRKDDYSDRARRAILEGLGLADETG